MMEATFISSGKNMNEAIDFTAKLTGMVLTGGINILEANKIDIFCCNIDDASHLDNLLWETPKYCLVAHNLVNKSSDDPVKIGYPGTKFVLGSDTLLNLSPDFPPDLSGYKNYLQMVVMDEGDLRERAAETWSKCKEIGLKARFVEDL